METAHLNQVKTQVERDFNIANYPSVLACGINILKADVALSEQQQKIFTLKDYFSGTKVEGNKTIIFCNDGGSFAVPTEDYERIIVVALGNYLRRKYSEDDNLENYSMGYQYQDETTTTMIEFRLKNDRRLEIEVQVIDYGTNDLSTKQKEMRKVTFVGPGQKELEKFADFKQKKDKGAVV